MKGQFVTAELLAFLEAWLPPPPARVLEVGCGDGELTRWLAETGHDALGIDPAAPEGERFERTTLEAFRAGAPFDAAVAIRSLHHMHDLDAALASLRRALAPGGRLVMFEFAVEHVDGDSREWVLRHIPDAHVHDEPPHVIPVATLMAALGGRFRLLSERWGAYLAREYSREDLHAIEEASIAAGELKPIGAWLVYELGG
jgi:ubiquinone/menaquinone biosynthesis C-methylase UbiE